MKKLPEQSSRYRKRMNRSPLTAISAAASVPSKKKESNPLPVQAKDQNNELLNEPLNRVLLVDVNSPLAEYNITWAEMNLIIAIDYGRNTFSVLKNRWGVTFKTFPLDDIVTFLYHPEISDARELHMEHIRKHNEHACTDSEQ